MVDKGKLPALRQEPDKGSSYLSETSLNINSVVRDNTFSNINTEGGDVKVGVFQAPSPSKISLLIEASKAYALDSDEYRDLIEELENYHKPRPGRRIVGLENKLNNANMDSLVEEAKYLKGRAITKVARYQLQSHKAAVNNYIYGKINEIFNAEVLPLIKSGLSSDQVNHFISQMIIQPLADEICVADPTINSDTIRGMLYILTGNCHLTWS